MKKKKRISEKLSPVVFLFLLFSMSAERDKNYPRIGRTIEISLDNVVRCIYIRDIRIPDNRICVSVSLSRSLSIS